MENIKALKLVKVLNLAKFIAIKGLPAENDISLKIYYYLREKYNVQSLFVKSVPKIPKWAALLKNSLRKRRNLFKNDSYIDENYNIPVKFFGASIFLLDKLFTNGLAKVPIQYKLLKNDLIEEIKNFMPDLIHAHGVFPEGYYAFQVYKNQGIPYIVTLRGEYDNKYESETYKNILNSASQLHTPSYALFDRLKDNYQIGLLPHPLESKWLGNKIYKQFESLRLITVCRLLKMKNIEIVLKAVKKLFNDGIKVTYTIVGDGNYRSELENLTRELGISGIVSFKGYRSHEEIKEYYSKANIFVMLSRPETYGRVYFEAAAQGLVVIGSKNTGADGHLSENEAIFINETVEDLLHVLKNIPKDRLIEISNNAQRRVLDFTEDKITFQYFNIIKEAVKTSVNS